MEEHKTYTDMNWVDIKLRAKLQQLYNKEVDEECTLSMGFKFSQRSFADFLTQHMENENKIYYKKHVECIIDDSIPHFIETYMDKCKRVYEAEETNLK